MEVEIYDKELLKLYSTGRTKKIKIPENIKKKFLMRINIIQAAANIYDLWEDKAAKFKEIKGENKYSMRLNRKYRLEMEVIWEDENKTVGTFIITKISKHYE